MTLPLARSQALSSLALRFGQVYRITQHPDGSPESDTTHTVMLALVAMELAALESSTLDIGKVAAFAAVHDLPEAYAGDTPTAFRLTPDEQAAKDGAEEVARQRIREDLGMLSVVAYTLDKYEAQDTPEARFVKCVDKLLPRLLAISNRCATPCAIGMTRDQLADRMASQGAHLRERYPEFHLIHDLHEEAARLAVEAYR